MYNRPNKLVADLHTAFNLPSHQHKFWGEWSQNWWEGCITHQVRTSHQWIIAHHYTLITIHLNQATLLTSQMGTCSKTPQESRSPRFGTCWQNHLTQSRTRAAGRSVPTGSRSCPVLPRDPCTTWCLYSWTAQTRIYQIERRCSCPYHIVVASRGSCQ